jgi:hypothetical protein
MSDGDVHEAKVAYVPGTLMIFLDDLNSPVLVVPVDLETTLNLDNGQAWVGLTAATGAITEAHDILSFSFNGDGVVERACPLNAQARRIIVEFPQDVVLTTRSQSENFFGPLTVNIPAATYDITLVSFDDHIKRPKEEDQKQEAWFLQAQSEEGDIVFESNPISDLPKAKNIPMERVEKDVQITQDITGLLARHVLDVGESETAESVSPICVAFDLDATWPFTFRIDPNIQPSERTLPGLNGGPPRPVGVTIGPDGNREEFVVNEVALDPSSEADLHSFLTEYGVWCSMTELPC